MKLPKVLVSGKFNPEDLVVSVSESNRKVEQEIESKLEAIWEAKVRKAEEDGRVCYNGVSYRINSLKEKEGKIILDFATFEYKVRDGLVDIPGYFDLPEEYYGKGCFSSCSVKTSDGRYIMVELTGKSMNQNSIELVGGIMETNVAMSTGYDVFKSCYKELEEEAGITEADIEESYLQTIYLGTRANVGFYFEVILNVDSNTILERFKGNKDSDIKSVRMFERVEYLDILKNHRSLNKHLTANLLQI